METADSSANGSPTSEEAGHTRPLPEVPTVPAEGPAQEAEDRPTEITADVPADLPTRALPEITADPAAGPPPDLPTRAFPEITTDPTAGASPDVPERPPADVATETEPGAPGDMPTQALPQVPGRAPTDTPAGAPAGAFPAVPADVPADAPAAVPPRSMEDAASGTSPDAVDTRPTDTPGTPGSPSDASPEAADTRPTDTPGAPSDTLGGPVEDVATRTPAEAPTGIAADPVTAHAPAGATADRALRNEVTSAYAPLAALCELFDDRSWEGTADGPAPAGWRSQADAVRAFTDGHVHGDWSTLARLMVDPAALVRDDAGDSPPPSEADPTDLADLGDLTDLRNPTGPAGSMEPTEPTEPTELRDEPEAAAGGAHGAVPVPVDGPVELIEAAAGDETAAVIRDLVRLRAGGGERTLLLASDEAALQGLLAGVSSEPEILAVRVQPREPAAVEESRPESRGHEAVIRAVGDSHLRTWESEIGRLRRELLWLEQWPRDRAALARIQADHERRRGELSAGEDAAAEEIRELRAAAAAAEQEATAAQETRDRLDAEHRSAAEESAAARARWEELQAAADAAARAADERTRAAEESHARHAALDGRVRRCEAELEEARKRERTLLEDLVKAKESLPEATAEVEHLTAASTQAAAVGHACYYRLTAAESALAAERRKLSLGQRLRLSRPHPELDRLRKAVTAHRKEADEAATRARQAGEALERAKARRAELAAFLDSGDDRLAEVGREQERLSDEIVRFSRERDAALAEHREHADGVSAALEASAEAAEAARRARDLSRRAEQRFLEAGRAVETATTEVERTAAESLAAGRLAESDAGLERRRGDGTADITTGHAEVEAAAEAEARSRRHVEEICGVEPGDADEETLSGHRARAMAAIERLIGYVELLQDPAEPDDPAAGQDGTAAAEGPAIGHRSGEQGPEDAGDASSRPARLDALGEVLLEHAGLVCATAQGLATCPALVPAVFDTLIVAGAGRVTDGEFLVGAVRSGRWIMVGDRRDAPAGVDRSLADHVLALTALHIAGRSADADPDSALDAAVETVTGHSGAGEEDATRSATVRAEAGRIRAGGLWDGRYRESCERALGALGDPDVAGGDARWEALMTAMAERWGTGVFARCAAAAPELLGRPHPR